MPVSITKQRDSMQILYPSDISSDLFSSIYKLNGDFPEFQFNQILIDFESSDGAVYFISEENKEVYAGSVPVTATNQLKNIFLNEVKQFAQYFPVTLDSGKTIYLPKDRPELMYSQLIKEDVSSDQLKKALFGDPSLVQKNPITPGFEFTDGQKLMRESRDSHTITYIDLSEVESAETIDNNYSLIQKSVDFVNNHGGWTDDYRFARLDEERNMVHFRIYSPEGYPVFGENNPISELEVEWSATGVSRYNRNNFSLGQLAFEEPKTLDSGEEAS